MSMQYKMVFGRCGGEMRVSGPQFVQADSFADAHQIANDRITGMRGADPDGDYFIVEICHNGVYGVDCSGGARLFETADEFTARVAAQSATS